MSSFHYSKSIKRIADLFAISHVFISFHNVFYTFSFGSFSGRLEEHRQALNTFYENKQIKNVKTQKTHIKTYVKRT